MAQSRDAAPSPLISSPFTRALLAGGLAGTTVDLSLYPLDTLKTRLQSSSGFLHSGGFSGIYRGVGSALVGSAPGAALFFVTYESTKTLLRRGREADARLAGNAASTGTLGAWAQPVEHMVAASLGEVAACAVRVPTEVIKQRAQAVQHPSSLAALRHILAARHGAGGYAGVGRELYRGWAVTVMREVPFTVIQFPLWEGMKTAWAQRSTTPQHQQQASAISSAVFGSIAGAVAAAITTPLDVLKTRMMLARERPESLFVLLRQIVAESGPRAFFAGIGPRVFWISAGGAIFLGSYQWGYNMLGGGGAAEGRRDEVVL
ncbi:MAG: hypothetical protein M1819_001400 [Sarea resinae]|nr:MAG: hypothetical protein M1819_001400 [Sarea resinae]